MLPSPPPIDLVDIVVPFPYFDVNPAWQCIVLDLTVRFDAVLEPKRLHSSLSRILEIGEWRKLGARLRRNLTGVPLFGLMS